MISIITKVVNSRIPCFFISPHLDDAILSAGSLIEFLSKHTEVKIINIFTKASPKPYTKFAQQFLQACGFIDAGKLFLERKKEDEAVFGKLNIKTLCADFTDVAWRKKTVNYFLKTISVLFPNIIHLYPTRKDIFSGRLAEEDENLLKEITQFLENSIPNMKKSLVFCPLGAGNHIDHIITWEVCHSYFSNLIYWSDFPYCNNYPLNKDLIRKNKLKRMVWMKESSIRQELILNYSSQTYLLFPDGYIPPHKEVYFFNPEVLKNLARFS